MLVRNDNGEEERLNALFERLREKLLDLTKRNRMLNYSLGARSKRQIQIVDEVPEEIYRRLTDEAIKLDLVPLPEPKGDPADEKTPEFSSELRRAKVTDVEYLTRLQALESSARDDDQAIAEVERELRDRLRAQLGMHPRQTRAEINRNEVAKNLGIDPSPQLPASASKPSHSDKKIQTLKYPDELENTLEKIGADARLAEQEMGLSTLFLAFGFIEWFESNTSEKPHFAPLLLLPVKLEVRKLQRREVFSISATAENVEENLSLQKFLERDFGRDLPDFEIDEEKKKSETIEGYIDKANTTIKGLARWRVHRWMVLGHFAFGRLAMYADIAPENWKQSPVSNRLIRSVLSGTESPGEGGSLPSVPDDYSIDDEEVERLAPYLIHDADASQHSALVDVMKSTDLVIQGPPGTGKSQTITNIIANCLAAKKRVLFLSEKLAALEVVKRRLDSAGLGEFCLEIHSDKSSPRNIVESIKRRLEVGEKKQKADSNPKVDGTWAGSKKEISDYLNALHGLDEAGQSPYSQMWHSIRGRADQVDAFDSFKGVFIPAVSSTTFGQVGIYANVAQSFADSHGHPARSPWFGWDLENLRNYEVSDLVDAIARIASSVDDLQRAIDEWQRIGISNLADVRALIAAFSRISADPPSSSALEAISGLDTEKLEYALQLKRAILTTLSVSQESPELSVFSLQTLTHASEILRVDPSSSLGSSTPAEAISIAGDAIEQNRRLISNIGAIAPALALLGLDATLPANGLDAVASVCLVASKIDQSYGRWVGDHREIDVQSFQAARNRWRDLIAREEFWRSRLVNNQTMPWPALSEVAGAAEALNVRGISKLAGKISGDTRKARELLIHMGFDAASLPSPHELRNLTAHVEEVEAFESDTKLKELFASDWAGLDTPVEEIEYGIGVRAFMAERISTSPLGSEVMKRFVELGANGIFEIGRLSSSAAIFRSLDPDTKKRFDNRSVEVLLAELREETEGYRKIIEIDLEQSITSIKRPLVEIHKAANALRQRNDLEEKLKQPELVREVTAINLNPNALEQFPSAINWKREIQSLQINELVRERLVGPGAEQFYQQLRQFCSRAQLLLERLEADRRLVEIHIGAAKLDDSSLSQLSERLSMLVSRRSELVDLLSLQQQRKMLGQAGLTAFLENADRINLEPSRLPTLLELLVAHNGAETARRQRSPLSTLSGAVLEAHRRAFSERDRRKIDTDRKTIFLSLLKGVPIAGNDRGPKKEWTEMALLRHEIGKSKRFTPIRSMIQRAGKSIQILKPCFMMSPLSLAKFLPAGAMHFDLVVIDEASQMKPEDALGGLLRTDQIVVVGDPKQLPPTDFFNRTGGAAGDILDEEFEDIDDESILQACHNAFRQVRRLKWHYRSRCESLIAFSNRMFYDDGLITFPSAKPEAFSVDLIRVDGSYQARRNVAEATRIAEEAVKFMRHFAGADRIGIPTLGIAAVNIEQRDLIREEIHRLAANDDLIDEYFAKVEEKGEPLFVKNLENVQGDERDYIFVSLTYGRAPNSTVMKQRFGPINGKYGHRRLNVLFSRARVRLALFSSFGSIDVVPAEKSHEGVHILKRYLEYAENRGFIEVSGIEVEPDSDFEIAVADRLRGKGYKIDYQVGVSGFRIDLGVRHPKDQTRFMAGIECDGASYHSSKSARDRDRLREQVLRDNGWEILRVWSTDWFENPDLETDRLVKKLEQLGAQEPRLVNDYSL